MKRKVSVAHLTAIDLSPPDLIEAAATAGFDGVGLRLIRVTEETPGYPLMQDRAMMAATRHALAATGLSVSDIEFIKITPDLSLESLAPFLDAGAELGAGQVIAAPYDDDDARLVDRLSGLAGMAAARGLGVVLEFFPWTVVPDLSRALEIAGRCEGPVGILVDALHFDRSRSSLDALRAAPPELFPFAHLCDAPVHPPYSVDDLLRTARGERLAPGAGQIDLAAILKAMPAGIPVALEIPAGTSTEAPAKMLARLRAAAQRLLDEI